MKNILSDIINCAGKPVDFALECEKEYHEELLELARRIKKNDSIKIVMIAGPSASGKTTTANILCGYLDTLGLKAKTVSLDNFYFDREKLPLLDTGEKDTESINSLDVKEITRCLTHVVNSGSTVMPYYDFTTGKSIKNKIPLDISDGGIIVAEGLHALNPAITDALPQQSIYKIYISVSEEIYDTNGQKLLSSRKVRFVRRALRDKKFRNADINVTLKMWPAVVQAEEKYLYPFKAKADKVLITLHSYEICVYKREFLEMMKGADKNLAAYPYAAKIIPVMEKLPQIDESTVPYDSLLREFLGGGKYSN